MNDLRRLEQKLASNLDWHGARIKFLARFMSALITTRSVNLAQLAPVFAGRAKPASHYQTCHRFLKNFELPLAQIARFVVRLLGVERGWTLALDRTHWQFAQTDLNLLMLALVHEGIAYPLIWLSLDKAGNSNTEERILLLELFRSLFAKEQVKTLVADREFVGQAWLAWLTAQELPFQIRVKESYRVTARGRCLALRALFRQATPQHPLCLKRPCQMWGSAYYFSGFRRPDGQYVLLVAPTYEPSALAQYRQRWGIETLFGALKTRGFNLEDTHITKEDRLQKLVALLALTFCWCHRVGLWLQTQKAAKPKQHGRLPHSIFRRGLDCLRRLFVLGTERNPLLWHQVLHLLSST